MRGRSSRAVIRAATYGQITLRTIALILLANSASPHTCRAAPRMEIVGYDTNGVMTFAAPHEGERFTLEYTTDLQSGTWTNWGTLTETPITGVVMGVPIPLYFRLSAKPRPPSDMIPDAALRLHLCTHGYDENGDFRIDDDETARISDLMISDAGFKNLNLSPLTNMVTLTLNLRLLENLVVCGTPLMRVELPPSLTNIFLISNRIVSLNVANQSPLVSLICASNAIVTLDLKEPSDAPGVPYVSSLHSLKYLDCSWNQLANLDISFCTNLTYVNARGNPLTEICVWWDPTNSPPITLLYDGSPVLLNPP